MFPHLRGRDFVDLIHHDFRKYSVSTFDHWMGESEYEDYCFNYDIDAEEKMKAQCEAYYLHLYDNYTCYLLVPNLRYGLRFLKVEARSEYARKLDNALNDGHFFAAVFPEISSIVRDTGDWTHAVYTPEIEASMPLVSIAKEYSLHILDFDTEPVGQHNGI